jgi:tetratricopeptide (TPR) repeat protein
MVCKKKNRLIIKSKIMKTNFLVVIALLILNVNVYAQKGLYGSTPEDSINCVNNYSLYIEYFKQDAYNEALKGWRNVCLYCPKLSESTFQNGYKIFKQFADNETDETKKAAYVDTIMWIYDQRILHFGNEGSVLERKGADMQKYTNDPQATYNVLNKSFELQGKEMGAVGLLYLYKSLFDTYRAKKATKEDLINTFPTVMDVVEYNIQNASNDKTKEGYEKAAANIEKIFSSVANCDDLIAFYTPKFNENPKDTNLLKNIVKFLGKQDCTDAKLYEEAAIALHGIKPMSTSAMAIAKLKVKKDKCSEAISFFLQGAELANTDDQKIEGYMNAAKCNYNNKDYSAVRTNCLKALSINPNYGEAYLLIGDAYSASSKQIGDNECTSKSVYWAAVDKYTKAKNMDASVAESANKKIAAATAQYPKKTDCFFHSINDGDSYTVGGWINETTTVRVRE